MNPASNQPATTAPVQGSGEADDTRRCAGAWFSPRSVFIAALLLALGYALATDRVWEDYYITWKSSKNLAEGNGLVFHPGERVHTFTSPLGVLLPALCHVLTFKHSDIAALWLFRVLSGACFAGAVTLLLMLARRLKYHPAAGALLALWLMTDAKSVDFSVNGMETGILLLFVAYSLWAFLGSPDRQWLHLGLSWGGLMWSRPDGFIYIAALCAGVLLFHGGTGKAGRVELMKLFLRAGLVCTVVYLPWFAGAWAYYGSPVPHTVVAKGNAVGDRSLWEAVLTWLSLPWSAFKGLGSLDGLFMPSGHFFGGWPEPLLRLTRFLAGMAAVVWLLPKVSRETRVVAFALSILLAYLGYFPGTGVAGWYLPGPAWMALFAFAGVLSRGLNSPWKWARRLAFAAGLAWCGLSVWLLVEVTRLSKVEQVMVEDGHRRVIGEWLKENAAPGDRVFMECLGYLGYFSGLKTLDFPGLSSPEVVAASKRVGLGWNRLIDELRPEWLVLRPFEAAKIEEGSPGLLARDYREVRIFDVSGEVERRDVYGQGLLAFDSIFIVLRRNE